MLKDWGHTKGGDYVAFLWRAVTEPEAFATFRRNPRYAAVVETVQPETGQAYLDLIRDETMRRVCFDSEAADRIGGAITHRYGSAQLAPTTLRYGKVLRDLVALFPHFASIDAMVEVGIGHGGQARIIAEYTARIGTALDSYTALDLLPALYLARLYLENFALRPRFRFVSKLELDRDPHWGLVISNYAFSELGKTLQDDYLVRVLDHCDAGYLTMNSGLWRGEWQGHECLTVEQLLARLPHAALILEDPLTAPDNYVVVFGRHSAGAGVPLDQVRTRARAWAAQEPIRKKRGRLLSRIARGDHN